jgi:hypothetical protein
MKGQIQKRATTSRVRVSVITLAVLVVITGLVFWARNASGTTSNTTTATQSGAMTQTNGDGQITIKVTWRGRSAGPVFSMEMDTHAVDLDGYDLRQLAVLHIGQGQEMRPTGWNAPSGGHHRIGTLSFPSATVSGSPVIAPDTHIIKLIIRNVGGIAERTFLWTL